MAKGFVETNDDAFDAQLHNFSSKLPNYKTLLGFTAEELDEAKNDSLFWSYTLKGDNLVEKYAKDFKKSKSLLRKGSGNGIFNGLPDPPDLGVPPHKVAANIQYRFSSKAKKAKASTNYTKAIGADLGIEAPHQTFEPSQGKPNLSIFLNAGHPEISYVKSKYNGLALYKDSGDGFKFLATLIKTRYVDKTPLPPSGTSKVWRYKAIYIWQDNEIGKWSDENSIAVAG
jgi:hypothetical protein